MSKIVIIIPTYNEVENLEAITKRLINVNPEVDVLVVDDNSPDGTGKLADKLAQRDPRIRVLHRTEKQGLAPAYFAGFHWALAQDYEWIGQMDADGSHLPEQLPNLILPTKQDIFPDLIIGSRNVTGGSTLGWARSRELLSRVGNLYIKILLGMHLHDVTAGYRIYRAEFLRRIDTTKIRSKGYGFQVEMTWKVNNIGGVTIEVPITFTERLKGKSKISKNIVIEALKNIAKIAILERFLVLQS